MRKTSERFASVFLLLICAVWLIWSGKIPNSTLPGAPGPKFFPFIIIGALAFLTILNEVLLFRRSTLAKKEKPAVVQPENADKPEDRSKRKKVILSFVLVFLYVLGIDYLGFYPSTIITVFLALKFLLELGWIKVLISTGIISASVFGIFTMLFKVPLPRGIF